MTSGTRVTALVVAPTDPRGPRGPRAGGIQGFVDGFIKFAPDDFAIEMVGLSVAPATRDDDSTDWRSELIEGREVRFLPVMRTNALHGRGRIPVSARFVAGMLRQRRRIETKGRIVQFHRPGTAVPLLSRRAPMIQLIHHDLGQIESGHGENRWRLVPTIFERVERITLARMAAIFTVSESVALAYCSRFPALADRIGFLPNWVDDTIFQPLAPEVREQHAHDLRRRIDAPRDAWVMLWVGRLESIKAPELAIEAFAAAGRDRHDLHLVFVGSGSQRGSIDRLVRRPDLAGRVHLLGSMPRHEVAATMGGADALVISSHSESGPTIALEGLASGLPVVSTPVGRIRQLVDHQRTGFIASGHIHEAVADGMRWVMSNPRGAHRDEVIASGRRYAAPKVLQPFYELHYRLAGSAQV